MKTLVFANQKGGVGKSTLTCLMAQFLADRERARTLVVDLDAQRNTSDTLRRYDAGVKAVDLFEPKRVALPHSPSGLTLLPASTALANLEVADAAQANARVRNFAHQVRALEGEADYALIDPPPTLSIRMISALAAADFVVAPIELEDYSMTGVTALIKTILGVRQQRNPKLKFLGILANRFTHNSVRQKAALTALFEQYADFMLPMKISTRAAIPRALEEGVAVWRVATTAAREAAKELLPVFDWILDRMKTSETAEASS